MIRRYAGGNAGNALLLAALLAFARKGHTEQRPIVSGPHALSAALPDAPDPQTLLKKYEHQSIRSSSPIEMRFRQPTCDHPTSIDREPVDSCERRAPVDSGKTPTSLYRNFMVGPKNRSLTKLDKAWLAARNVADPFNLLTVGGESAISVGVDSHSSYGPGFTGYGRSLGVSFSQDVTGEFVCTFLIPALTHQDPHYHRMENRSIPRRMVHATAQIVWTRADSGKGILNYANLAGFAIHDEISNLYVPGRRTDGSATAERYATGLATAPIGNFVDEFLPDLAKHIHVQHVILRRIVNQVAQKETAGSTEQ